MDKNILNIFLTIVLIAVVFVAGYFLKNKINFSPDGEKKPIVLNSDLKIETLSPGTGDGAKTGNELTVNYTGKLENGTVFDTSYGKQPFVFTLGAGQVIKGWDRGLVGMKVSEKRKLIIPPSFAYGESGISGVIPPDSTLIFEVELLKINQ